MRNAPCPAAAYATCHYLLARTALRRQWWLLLLLLLLAQPAAAQTAASYVFAPINGVVAEPTPGGLIIGTSSTFCKQSAVQNIGFTFTFAGSSYTQFTANAGGVLQLGAPAGSSCNFPNSIGPSITPASDAFGTTGYNGGVYFGVQGTAPNRKLVVEWKQSGGGVTDAATRRYQVWLFEGSNAIQLVYARGMADPSGSSPVSIGIAASFTDYLCVDPASNTASSTSVPNAQDFAFTSDKSFRFEPFGAGVSPTISSFTPGFGGAGTSVTVTGARLSGATGVRVNGTAGTITANTSGSLTFTVGAGTSSGRISLSTPGGLAVSSAPFALPATIISFTPTSGPTGSSVTIAGTELSAATAVAVNGTPGIITGRPTNTRLTFTVGVGSSTGSISMTSAAGTATSAASYTVTGGLSSIAPGSGPVGTSVVITGTNLGATTSVLFGAVPAAFTINSATQLTTTVPRLASTGQLRITGSATVLSGTAFTVTRANTSGAYNLATASLATNGSTNAVPALADFDGNGRLDLLLGRADGSLSHYEQNAANTAGFTLVTNSFGGINVGGNAAPALTDFNGDGRLDLVIGRADGTLSYYAQTAVNATSFSLVSHNFNSIDTGDNSAPTFTDLDGDGRLELLLGKLDGSVGHFEQNPANSTNFYRLSSNFNGLALGGSSSLKPCVVDVDGNGLLDVLLGRADGSISRYEQIAANSTTVTLITASFGGLSAGTNAAPAFTDVDGDGDLDLLLGRGTGAVDRYEQPALAPTISAVNPVSGPVGTSVTITGANLTGATAARVNGTAGTITANSAGSLTFTVAAGSTTGPVSVTTPGGTATTGGNFTVTVPATTVVSLDRSSGNPRAAPQATYQLTFAAPVAGLTVGNFSIASTGLGGVVNVSSFIDVSGNGTVYNVTVNGGTGSGTLTLSLANSTGLSPTVSNVPFTGQTFTFDRTAPTATISSSAGSSGGSTATSPIPFTVTFSEPLGPFAGNDLASGEVNVSNGTISGFSGNGTSYTFSVTPTAAGAVAVSVPAGAAQDAVGNNNLAAGPFTLTYAPVAPTTTIVSGPPTVGNASTVGFVFSSNQSPVEYATSGAPNATYSNNGPNSSFGPIPDGTYTLSVAARNTSTNLTDATPATYNFTVDTQRPDVSISSTAGSNGGSTSTSPIPFTVTFSEGVTGFIIGDIAVSGGTKSALSGSGSTYTFSVTPTGPGSTVTVNVAANVAQDAATNQNTAAAQFSLTYAPVPTITAVNPVTGPVGTSVTITGTNLSGATAAKVNGTVGTITANTATSLTFTVGAGSTTGLISITTPGGTATTPSNFTVILPLTLVSRSPARNARAAARTASVALTFDQVLTNNAATRGAVKVFSAQRGGRLQNGTGGTATVSGSVLTFDPTTDFRPGETVFATLTTAATASAGGTLAAGQVAQFTTTTGGTGGGNFGGGSNPGVGTSPTSTALGDVDGDGDLDLVTANYGSASVSVRLNDGTGTYASATTVAVGSGPNGVTLADVDGDGDLDILTANYGANTVSVRLNNGSGTFSSPTNVAVGTNPANLTLGDVDADGDLDLLTANYGANTVSVCLNNGSGSFSGTGSVAVGTGPYHLALGDVDADGNLDILTANSGGGTVSVRLGDGDGSFAGTGSVAVGTGPRNVALADIDGDGDLDMAVANFGSNTVSVRLNDGSGSFAGTGSVAVGGGPFGVSLGDVDADGDLDMLTANSGDGTVSVRLNNGSGSFSGTGSVAVGTDPRNVALADIDGDGDLDLAVACVGSNAVSLRFNRPPAPTITAVNPVSGPVGTSVTITGTNLTGATAAKVNGTAGSITANTATSLTFTVGAGSTTGPVAVTTPGGTATSSGSFTVISAPVIASFAPASGPAGTVVTITGTGLTGTTSVLLRGIPCNITPISATQVSFVVPALASAGAFRLTTPVGSALSPTAFVVTRASASLTYVLRSNSFNSINVGDDSNAAFTDLDHDGLLDMLVGQQNGDVSHYEQSAANSTAFTLVSANLSGLTGHYRSLVSVTDTDGDGLLELLVGTGAGNFKRYEQTAANSTAFTQLDADFNNIHATAGLSLEVPHVTDVDGDGLLDLLVGANFLSRYGQTVANGSTFTRLNNQNFGPTANAGNGGAAACVTDLDGDGLLDMLVGGQNGRVAHYAQASPNGTAFMTINSTFSGLNLAPYSTPVITDLDGNGLLDLLVGGNDGMLRHYEQVGTPTITSFTPSSGPVGTSVTITGTFLAGATSVRVNGTAGSITGTPSATSLTFTVGAGSTTGAVSVTTAGGTATSSGSFTVAGLVLVSRSPARNAWAAPHAANVALTFDRPLTNNAATLGAVKVFSSQRGGRLQNGTGGAATVSGNTLTFDPTTNFKPGETIFTTVTTAASSAGGGTLARGQVQQFTAATGGTGRGSFTTGSTVGVGDTPTAVVVGDVDGDGDLDLLTADNNSNAVSVRLNGGNATGSNTGSFSNGSTVPVGSGPIDLVLGDVDGDGDLDLLTANLNSGGTVSVRLNGGDATGSNTGTFSNGAEVAMGSTRTVRLVLGDVDGDGDLDLLAVNQTSNKVSVRLNGGDATGSNTGTFSNGAEVAAGTDLSGLALGDVDGDGDLDLVVSNEAPSLVTIRLNGGDATGSNTGTFSNGTQLAVGLRPQNLQLSDVDGDGDLDLLTVSFNANTVSVRLNGGDATGSSTGTFSNGSEVAVGAQAIKLVLGDVDGDGDLDLLTTNFKNNGTASVRLNGGDATGSNTGTFGNGSEVTVGNSPYGVAHGDVDGDGDLDLLAANYDGTVSVRLNGGTGPLPVKLVRFTAAAQGRAALLAWATATETNSSYFQVQRSVDGRTFTSIGQLAGQGSSSTLTHYQFIDPQPGSPLAYYRLNQVDLDGTTSFSAVRTVRFGVAAGLVLHIYPNPAQGPVQVRGATPDAELLVLDALGRVILTGRSDAVGTARLALPKGLPAGMYVVRNGEQAVRLIVE